MTQLQLARNAWHNYNYTECITQSQPNSNTRHTQTRHGSSTMFCNEEQDLILLCNNPPHARFVALRVQCLELTQTQTTSTNRWSTNWHKHYNINNNLSISHCTNSLCSGESGLSMSLRSVVKPSWSNSLKTYNNHKHIHKHIHSLNWSYTLQPHEEQHILCLSSSSFITASALQSTEQHEPTQQTITHGQDTH